MARHGVLRVLTSLLLLAAWPAGAGSVSDSERIKGVAEFLIDRANDNYLYMFEKAIRDNAAFACYFPTTRENLEVGGLKELLYSRGLWRKSIKTDLDALPARVVSSLEGRLVVSERSVLVADEVLLVLQQLAVEHEGVLYPLDQSPLDADSELSRKVNGFSRVPAELIAAMARFRSHRSEDFCAVPARDLASLRQEMAPLMHLDDTLRRFTAHLREHARDLRLREGATCRGVGFEGDDCAEDLAHWVHGLALRLGTQMESDGFAAAVAAVDELIDSYDDDTAHRVERVIAALKTIRASGTLDDARLDRLTRHIMFFAQVSDSRSANEVEGLLRAYTLPSVSFFRKRELGSHWLLSSYLGVAGGETEDNDAMPAQHNDAGLYAPIGLEWSWGSGSHSWSLMLSPVDFGYPVSLKLNGIDEDVAWEEVFAPSLGLAWGMPETPLVVGIAWQQGRRFPGTSDTEERLMLFVAFDMPLLPLRE